MSRELETARRNLLQESTITSVEERVEAKLTGLSPEKRKVVDGLLADPLENEHTVLLPTTDGPPGTGKTHVASVGAGKFFLQDPYRTKVVLIAFTNYAVNRLKEEMDKIFPPDWTVRVVPNPEIQDPKKGVVGCDPYRQKIPRASKRLVFCAPFVVCTPFMASRVSGLIGASRPLIVFDEFSQIDPPTFFMTLESLYDANPRSVALFGDPLQLPVVTTQENLMQNIVSFLEEGRSFRSYTLEVQYRMHEEICHFVNVMRKELARFSPIAAGHPLKVAPDVRGRDLLQLGHSWKPEKAGKFREILDPSKPIVFVDTSELGHDMQTVTGSSYNLREAKLICEIYKAALQSLPGPERPKIITPYRAQARIIKQRLPQADDDVLTVYKAQGREYPFVLVSMVRNNEEHNIGFLDLPHLPHLRGQGYVAISRAKGKMIVLISRETFYPHPVFEGVLDEAERRGLLL